MDTINRLLKKQTPKMRRGQGRAAGEATPQTQEEADAMGVKMPDPPTMIRWVSNKDGIRLGVPGTWLGTPAARVFEVQKKIEEVK